MFQRQGCELEIKYKMMTDMNNCFTSAIENKT